MKSDLPVGFVDAVLRFVGRGSTTAGSTTVGSTTAGTRGL